MKVKHIVTLLLAAGLFFGCEPKASGDTGESPKSGDNTPPPAENVPQETEADDSPQESTGSTYTFHDVTYDISLNVIKKAGAIDFTVDVSNLDNNCKHTVKGSAKAKDGDLESRDLDDEAVFVQEYVYSGDDCELFISIDMDSESAAWINQGDCKGIDPMCKLEPKGYLTLNN